MDKKLDAIDNYPLDWPVGWPRTDSRKSSSFHTKTGSYKTRKKSIAEARDFVLEELRRFGVNDTSSVVISMDIKTRKDDGLPYANARLPEDPGVAVYFIKDNQMKVFPCDIYDRLPDNLYAIGLVIEAIRTIDRHGGDAMGAAAHSGFKALPEQGTGSKWWKVLCVDREASHREVRQAYKDKVKQYHPDKPEGSEAQFKAVHEAYKQFQQNIEL